MTTNLDILKDVTAAKNASPVMTNFMTHMIEAESNGNANARPKDKNGRCLSSAYGLCQMLDGTWNNMVKKHPELTNRGDARQQILAGFYYAQENAASLQKNGNAVTEGNLYLCHFLGAGGANKVLSAGPGARLADVAGAAVMNSNKGVHLDYTGTDGKQHKKMFADFTVGDLQAWSTKKMGGKIRYDLLDREVQDSVEPWKGDDENPRNNFRAMGNMGFGDILAALLMSMLGNMLGSQPNLQGKDASAPAAPTPTPAPAPFKGEDKALPPAKPVAVAAR